MAKQRIDGPKTGDVARYAGTESLAPTDAAPVVGGGRETLLHA